ncbi:unnamed protein product [Sympodiomycopsis kandeliae]
MATREMASQQYTPTSPHKPSPLSPPRHGSFGSQAIPHNVSSNQIHSSLLARTGSSSGRSIGTSSVNGGGSSVGGHSRDSSHSQGATHPFIQKQSSQQSLSAAAAAAAMGSGHFMTNLGAGSSSSLHGVNGRLAAATTFSPQPNAASVSGRNNSFGAGGYGSVSPSPSRSSFGADSSAGGPPGGSLSNGSLGGISTSDLTTRPPLRGSLSEGMPPPLSSGAPSEQNSLHPSLYSSASGNGSASNLSSQFYATSLSHSTSNSSLHSPAGSIASPQYGNGLRKESAGIAAMQPPVNGPLSSSDPRTSLIVLNLPYKVRWQDLKDLFRRSAGTVLRADVSLTPDGMSRGIGSVLMRDAEDAKRARECFNGFEWMGRRLEVMIERGGGGGWESTLGESTASFNQQQQPIRQADNASLEQGRPPVSPQKPTRLAESFHGSSLSPLRASFGGVTDVAGSQAHMSPLAGVFQQRHSVAPISPHQRGSFSNPQMDSYLSVPQTSGNNLAGQMYQASNQSDGLPAPPSSDATPQHLSPFMSQSSPMGAHQVQQLRASSFSTLSTAGQRRPSAQSLKASQLGGSPFLAPQQSQGQARAGGSQSARASMSSPNLPAPPFPPPAPSPSATTNLPPGTIPTQHQLAVLSAQAAQAAVAAQQAKVVAQNGGMPQGSYYGRTLFVGNLSYATQWQDLKDLFRSAGNIVRADIALGAEGRSRGFGTALFATNEEAARAVRMFHGYDHNGRALKVHFDRFARMECPPAGYLVPARVEDYTSAFNAAQPPSNVGGGGTGSGQQPRTAGGSGLSASQQQQPIFNGQQHGKAQGFRANTGPQGLSPSSNQMLGPNFQPGSGASAYDYGQAAMFQQQSNAQHTFQNYQQYQPQQQQQPNYYIEQQHLAQPPTSLQQPFQQVPLPRSGEISPNSSAETDHELGVEKSSSVQEHDHETSREHTETDSSARRPDGPAREAFSGARPGRIELPAPPMMQPSFNPYAAFTGNGANNGPQGRAPMPMTPGVPLTPGMQGYSMAGIPPPTPPAFHAPFLSPGMGMMSPVIPGYEGGPVGMRLVPSTPGNAGPPTPWQVPGMSAAPGAQLRGVHPSQMTPRGVANGGSTFNPFFANAIGYQVGTMPQTPHWNVNPRHEQAQRKISQSTSAHGQGQEAKGSNAPPPAASRGNEVAQASQSGSTMDESALSSRSASPAVAPLPSADTSKAAAEAAYPFPTVADNSEADKVAGKDQSDKHANSATAAQASNPNGRGPSGSGMPAAFSLMTRRASTNSPAVSPGIFGAFGSVAANNAAAGSNTSFGYFGAALANAVQQSTQNSARDRRPSLGADDLRTPAREDADLGGGEGYFPSIGPGMTGQRRESGDSGGESGATNNQAATLPTSGATPKIAIGSTEEMARAIAKMSIEGTALKRTNSQRNHGGGGGGGEGENK